VEEGEVVTDIGEASRLFLTVFDRAAIGMALQHPDGCVLKANEAYCRLVGRSERDLFGLTWQAITHPDDVAVGEAMLHRAMREPPHGYVLVKRYVRPDGEIVWARITVTAVADADGRPSYQYVQAVDITEEVEAETRGKEFLREISHELRTPLTSVLGASTALQGRLADSTPEVRDQLIGLIASNAERMRELLDRLMGYARSRRSEHGITVGY